jgi:FMN phosphatase YigB (HAD superfamily)
MDTRPKTIICDIDGTLIEHLGPPSFLTTSEGKSKILEGTLEKLDEWEKKGYNIILLTGRKESLRRITEIELERIGIYYDHLIMGVGGGPRYLINDIKPNGDHTAFSINLIRNEGISKIKI